MFKRLALFLTMSAAPLAAQSFFAPGLQPSQITGREATVALVDAGSAGVVGQWRQPLARPKTQLTLEAGLLGSTGGGSSQILLGAGVAYQVATVSANLPVDVALTGGLGLSSGGGSTLTIPVGASIGRRFDLDGGFVVTPYLHPQLALTRVAVGEFSATDLDLNIDLGANVQIKPTMAIRLGLSLGQSDALALGISLKR
ncbi:MAG: hypothetical protein RL625_166 [Gemmatimonadota bacterium]